MLRKSIKKSAEYLAIRVDMILRVLVEVNLHIHVGKCFIYNFVTTF